jgi:PBSX family phage portal protein
MGDENKKVVRAIVTKGMNGTKIVPETELEKYRIARKTTNDDIASQQLTDLESIDFTSQNIIKPPYNLSYLWRFMELSTEHSSCVRQKASDVCGLGWKIVKRKNSENADLKQKVEIETFFDFGNMEETFLEITQNVWIDFEAIGNGYFEVIRDSVTKKPKAIYHIPAHTIRCTKDNDVFIQLRNDKKKIFRRFNTDVSDKLAKAFVKEKVLIELEKVAIEKNISREKINKGWEFDEATSEIIQIKNYTSRSSFYGIPEWIPSIGAILGNIECRDYNLKFFDNNGVPHYAIIIKGADLDEELENVISTFFSQEIRGDAHKTLIIPINSQDVEVTFEKLSTDIKDASFRMYKQDNRDEIIRAHRVPFSRMNVATPGKLGNGSAAEESETYKKSVIAPKQLIFEHRINEILISGGFGINDWVLRFNKLDATDIETDMRINTNYVKSGIKSINESRIDCDLEPKEGGDRLFLNTATGIVFLDELTTMSSGVAVGSQSEQKQGNLTQKALEKLSMNLEKMIFDEEIYKEKTKGLIKKLIEKVLKKK